MNKEEVIPIKEYVKTAIQPMTEWNENLLMKGVSISEEDKKAGSPKEGDMIAYNPSNPDDMLLIAKDFFEANYKAYDRGSEAKVKSLHNTDTNPDKSNVDDLIIWGRERFKLIAKASSENEGWMKSTKAMDVGTGCIVQVTTQQRNLDGSYAIAEALTYVPGVTIKTTRGEDKKINGRTLVQR